MTVRSSCSFSSEIQLLDGFLRVVLVVEVDHLKGARASQSSRLAISMIACKLRELFKSFAAAGPEIRSICPILTVSPGQSALTVPAHGKGWRPTYHALHL
jgi:hypothetical protein